MAWFGKNCECNDMAYFPFFMVGDRLRVLLVGGGSIAAAKLETLAASGARVTIVALAFSEGVRALAQRYACCLLQQPYRAALLEDCNLVVAATGDAALGEQIAADAKVAGVWINVVDNPPLCDFIFPAMIRRGPLQVAISTGGTSPVLARLLKQDFEQMLPEGILALTGFLQSHTPSVRSALPDVQSRRLFWERVIRGPVGRMLERGEPEAAESWFQAALAHACRQTALQAFHFVAVHSFDPDALTVRQVRLLGKADTILYEGGQGMQPILERYARRDGEKYVVAPEDDPVARYREHIATGGVLAYLAWAPKGGCSVRRSQLLQCAADHHVRVALGDAAHSRHNENY